uniref:SURF1-like protein n=1 Tax=Magallana gigas TaxID=29159 RepID=K1RHI6_MAGGI
MIGFLSSAWPFRGLEKTFCATTTKAISNLEELLKMSSRVISRIINTLPILIVAFVCVEYKRRLKSQAVQDRVRLQKEEKPIPLPTLMSKLKNEADLKDLEFTRVELEGEFDHDREVVIGYRANQQPHLTPKGSRWQKGVYIVTPFKLKETGDTVLVNRGWVPLQLADPKARVGGQVTGTLKILGLLRSTEKKNPFDFRPSQDSFNEKFFSYLNVDDIAKYLGTKCVFVDAVCSFYSRRGTIFKPTQLIIRSITLSVSNTLGNG